MFQNHRITANRMAADWLGSVVSINCGLTLGIYQGEVSSVNHSSQTISLKQPYHNGVRCPLPEVTFRYERRRLHTPFHQHKPQTNSRFLGVKFFSFFFIYITMCVLVEAQLKMLI